MQPAKYRMRNSRTARVLRGNVVSMTANIFTPRLFRSLFGAVIGFIFALFPLVYTYFTAEFLGLNDKRIASVAESVTSISNSPITISILGVFDVPIVVAAMCTKEALLCTLALGVAAGLAWWEADIDNENMGLLAGVYSSSAAIGAILSICIFSLIAHKDYHSGNITEKDVYLVAAALNILAGVCVNYFLSILQIRRRRDLSGRA